MGTTNRRQAQNRSLGERHRPVFDHLEARLALSGATTDPSMVALAVDPSMGRGTASSLSIVSTSPSNAAILTSSPAVLYVGFDRPLDGFSISNNSFDLVHVAADGSTSPLTVGEGLVFETLDPTDPTGSRVDLALTKTLIPGHYQVRLGAGGQIQGQDGTSVTLGGQNPVVSDFTFAPKTSGTASADDLRVIGPDEKTVSGMLDLAEDPGAVQYHKFTLAPGHLWQVGLEVSAHRDGGTLDSAVSVFDASGRLIATSKAGLSGNPGDPYLFQGLAPGTYYVGVSGRTNIPDASGRYNPSAGLVGSPSTAQGGPYRLHLVADPADAPVSILGLQVVHADPLSGQPTGLTIAFSGGLNPSGFQEAGGHPLSLIDQAGRSWSLSVLRYDAAKAQLSLGIDHPLAPGSYSLALNGHSLVDLAGRTPVSTGQVVGVLGHFDVAAWALRSGDLGPILNGSSSGVGAQVAVAPDHPVTEQFTVIKPGLYAFDGLKASDGIRFSILDGSGNVVATGPNPKVSGASVFSLSAGTYSLAVSTITPGTKGLTLGIRPKLDLSSSLLDGGVAQGPALNLRLVTSQVDFAAASNFTAAVPSIASSSTVPAPSVAASSASAGPVMAPTAGLQNTPSVQVTPSVVGVSTPYGASAMGWLFQLSLVGRPSPTSDQVGVVGLMNSSSHVAVAMNTDGLPGGLVAGPVAIEGGALESNATPVDSESTPGVSAVSQRIVGLDEGLLGQSVGSRREDDRTLADADWIGQVVAEVRDWFRVQPGEERDALKAAEPAATPGEVAAIEAAGPENHEQAETASLGSPIAIGALLAGIAYHYREKILSRPTVRIAMSKPSPILVGPHRRSRIRVR